MHREGFGAVERVVEELAGLPVPWAIASGWAIDLFLGRVTRAHQDVDIVLPRADQLALHEFMTGRGWGFVTYWKGKEEPWPPAMPLALPRHQVHAHRGSESLEFLFSEIEHGVWRYRRNLTVVRDAASTRLLTEGGIPYLAPEIVLLFKSKPSLEGLREKDVADFERALPHLTTEQRAWLHWALTASAPDHPWIRR